MNNIEQLKSDLDALLAKWNGGEITDTQFWDEFVILGRNAQMNNWR